MDTPKSEPAQHPRPEGSKPSTANEWTHAVPGFDKDQARAARGYFVRFWWLVLLPVVVAVILMLKDRKDDVVPDKHEMEQQSGAQ